MQMMRGVKRMRFAIFLLAALAALPARANSLSAGSAGAPPGGSAVVNLTLSARGAELTGLQFDLDFDARTLELEASAGPAASAAGKALHASVPAPAALGRLRYVVIGLNQNVIEDGIIARFTVRVQPQAAVGTYVLRLANVIGTRRDGGTLPLPSSDGSLQVITGPTPFISPGGVRHGASFEPEFSPQSWVTVFGSGLANTTRIWTAADFRENQLPTQLDGVSVTINGLPAYVYYISPTQLNVLAPRDTSEGEAVVQVRSPLGTSHAASARMQRLSPGFFMFEPESRRYVAAVHADGTWAAKPGLWPGVATRAVKPGDTVMLFATGFGPTNPPSDPGFIFASPLPLAGTVAVRIGGVAATVAFAGVVSNGLVQINVVVPELPDGDATVRAEIGGVHSPANAWITVRR